MRPREEDQWQEEDLEEPGEFSEEEFQELIDKLQAALDAAGQSGEGESYESPEPVDYRGDFKPEMVQLLARLQSDQSQDGEGQPLSKEELEQLLQESAELELGRGAGRHKQCHEHVRPEPHERGRYTATQRAARAGLRPAASR